MSSECDLKYEEIKKYIPMLDDIIRRLDTSPVTESSVQTNVKRLRFVRDMLSQKKNRMTMENLHDCEEFLVDLCAESPYIEPDPGCSTDPPTLREKSYLETVRDNLRTMVKLQEDKETLPEMLRVEETGDMHTAGSSSSSGPAKHRSVTRIKGYKDVPKTFALKRNYTRVLVSPDSSSERWSKTDSVEVNPVFSQSTRTSSASYSPSSTKKGRNIFSEELTRASKYINIPLNVPEDNLCSLNTKNVLTRIINCEDGDEDIEILRKIRKQLSRELKKNVLSTKSINVLRKKEGTEEVRPTDNESAVVEFFFGSLSGKLVLLDQSEAQTSTDKDENRKFQIYLLINSEIEMSDTENKALNKCGYNEVTIEEDIIIIDDDDDGIPIVPDRKMDIKETTDKEISENIGSDKLQEASDEVIDDISITPKEPVKYRVNFPNLVTDSFEPEIENVLQDSEEAAQVKTLEGTDIGL